MLLAEDTHKKELHTLAIQIASFLDRPLRLIGTQMDYQAHGIEEQQKRYRTLVRQFEQKLESKPPKDLQEIESDRTLYADYVREAAKNILQKKRG